MPVLPTEPSPADISQHHSARRETLLAAAAITAVLLAGYANSFRGEFVFDDKVSIRENTTIRRLWPISSVLNPQSPGTTTGRPFVNLTLALNYAYGRLDVRGYHAVNLAIHLLVAWTLFGTLRRTFQLPGMHDAIARNATGLALAIALVWGAHPLQTESVTYLVQRAESLMALMYLTTLYCVIRGATSPRGLRWYVAAALACAAGMATKEVMAAAPLIVLLYDRIFLSASFRDLWRRRWGLYAALASTWGLLAALFFSTGGRTKTAGFGYGTSPWDYGICQFEAIAMYLRLCFCPVPLNFDYGMSVAHTSADVVPAACLILALMAATVVALRYQPWIGFLGVAFFAILAPSSSVVPIVTQTMAEHRMYLPLAAVVTLTLVLFFLAWQHWLASVDLSRSQFERLIGVAPLLVLLAVVGELTIETRQRNKVYLTGIELWADCVEKEPDNFRAQYNYGGELVRIGELREAVGRFDRAIELNPWHYLSWLTRGFAHYSLQENELALQDYSRGIELNPPVADLPPVLFTRGTIHEQLGQQKEALDDYSRAVEIQANFEPALFHRGMLYKALGKYPEAIADFTKVIQLRPKQINAYIERGACHQQLGHVDQAIQDFTIVLAKRPDCVEASSNLKQLTASMAKQR